MPNSAKSVDTIHRQYIFADNPRDALEILDYNIRNNQINPKFYEKAILMESLEIDEDKDNPANYSLKFYSKNGKEELWIAGLPVGERSHSTNGTLQCLMLMGFTVDAEKDIFGLTKGAQKVFCKKGVDEANPTKKKWGRKRRGSK